MFIIRVVSLKTLQSASKQRSLINYYSPRQFSFSNACYKDEVSSKENPCSSLLQIKRYIKLNNICYQEGPTNIKTTCPVCETSAKTNDIFINKTTGKETGLFQYLSTNSQKIIYNRLFHVSEL